MGCGARIFGLPSFALRLPFFDNFVCCPFGGVWGGFFFFFLSLIFRLGFYLLPFSFLVPVSCSRLGADRSASIVHVQEGLDTGGLVLYRSDSSIGCGGMEGEGRGGGGRGWFRGGSGGSIVWGEGDFS